MFILNSFCRNKKRTKMKLPFSFHVSGSAVASFDHDVEIDDDNQENIGNDTAEAIFADYLWMEHEEEFDKIEMLRLDEEALVQNCLEDNREDDDADESIVIDSESVHWTEAQAEYVI